MQNPHIATDMEVKVEYLPTLVDKLEIPLAIGVGKRVKRQDVVLLQEDYQPLCHQAFLAARLHGIPSILSTERDYYPRGVKGYGLFAADFLFNWVLREQCDALTAHTTSAANFMRLHTNTPREVRVIKVGVDTKLFHPYRCDGPLREGSPKILTVARLHPYKGIDVLIRAMVKVVKKLPRSMLYVVGRGGEEAGLRHLVGVLGLEKNVTFITNSMPNAMMPQVYNGCDLYVQPSIVEPYGIAAVEAMSCGKPVIASRTGGLTDTVSYGRNGYLFKILDHDELAQQMLWVLQSGSTATRMGTEGRRRAVEEYDWAIIAKHYDNLIHELMEAKHCSQRSKSEP